MQSLAQNIVQAANAYYVDGSPIMSDKDFDNLVDRLREVSPNHPILTTTGWGASSRDWDVPHWHPMEGLDQIKYGDYGEDLGDLELLGISAKLDGISGTCRYLDGYLIDVLTRGDGISGKDITKNALATGKVSKFIGNYPGEVEVRGEFVLTYDNHKEMVKNDLAREDTNLRNVVAGAMNSDDPDKAAFVSFVAFEVIGDGLELDDLMNLFELVSRFTPGRTEPGLLTAWEAVSPYYDNFFPYPTDGLVIDTDKGKWKVKFDDLPSIVVRITVGMETTRTGRVIPHATYDETYLDGSYLAACTLNNLNWCRSFKNPGEDKVSPIWTGALVRIRKANQIIPEIIEVLEPVEVPSDEDIAYEMGLDNWYSTDSDIIDREARYDERTVIANFITSCMPKGAGDVIFDAVLKVLDGPILINDFFNNLKSYRDEWQYDLTTLENFGDHRLELLNQTFDQLKSCTWSHHDILINLSIPGWGDAKCQSALDDTNYDMTEVYNSLISIAELRKASHLRKVLFFLADRIVTPESKDEPAPTGRVNYSMTGKINGYSKSQFDELVDAIWNDDHYEIMVTDSDRISSKMQAALDNGKRIMSSSEFLVEYAK